MPIYHKEQFGTQLTAWLIPKGIKRRWFKNYVNYLTGDIIDYELKVKSSAIERHKYEWQLQDSRHNIVAVGGGEFISTNGTTTVEIGMHHLLMFEADYHIILTIDGHNGTLTNFYAFSRDKYYSERWNSWTGGIIGTIVGLILGFLLSYMSRSLWTNLPK